MDYKDRVILHADINNFYASVAIALNPDLKGRAIVVCGDPSLRHGIVLAKSEPAKKAGIKTGDAVWEAKRKCPEVVVIPPDYKKYVEYSRKVIEIYLDFTPQIESFGLDECWLDVTGCQKLFGSGEEIANKIRERVKREVGLTVSVGVSFTKVFAKLGSDMKKPDATTVIGRDDFTYKIWNLPVGELLYVGKSTLIAFKNLQIFTIGDLAQYDLKEIQRLFGKSGVKLREFANGIDQDEVKDYDEVRVPESIGNGTTTVEDVKNADDARKVIYSLCEVIGYRLRRHGLLATVVSVNLRNSKLESLSRQEQLKVPTNSSYDIANAAIGLLERNYDFKTGLPIRTITVGTGNLLSANDYVQASIFDDNGEKQRKLEQSLDKIRQKFGFETLKRGITMGTVFTCDNREIDEGFVPFDRGSKKNPTDG